MWVLTSMDDNHLSLNSMGKLLRSAGAERVSRDAKEKLRQHLQQYALDIGDLALTYTEHAGRSTVQESDIDSAIEVQ